jgi:alpha-1,6-mannosyltransferase
MLRQKPSSYFLVVLSLILYAVIAYLLERHQTLPLFACYFSLFFLYVLVVIRYQTIQAQALSFWIATSICFRLVVLFSEPSLSDDFYRFIWDGRLLAAGLDPFAEVPSFYMSIHPSIPGIDDALYNKLNSTETFTVYPPLAQFIFWLSAKLSPGSVYGSVMVMKVIVFAFEIATLAILYKLLLRFKQPSAAVLLYSLNPLVVLELAGNLHFEGIMIFFLLAAIWWLGRDKMKRSAFSYAVSICTKLIPLIFLPLLIRHLGWKKAFSYWAMVIALTILIFLPLLSMEMVNGLCSSLGYYFQRFEFNASVYYLIREAGYLIAGFNIIQYAGPILALVAASLILYISFHNFQATITGTIDHSFFNQMLWCIFIYFLSVTILHPWYIITLLAISILTPYRFPLVWTGAIFLTYAGYNETGFDESLSLVALEYGLVIAYLLYETVWMRQRNHF